MHDTPSPRRRRRRRPTIETIVEENEEEDETVVVCNSHTGRPPVEAPTNNRRPFHNNHTTLLQFKGLLWKELLWNQRHYGWTLLQVCSPAVLVRSSPRLYDMADRVALGDRTLALGPPANID